MGDRANVYVHEGDQPGVYLYTHWSGHELPEIVRQALARGQDRWSDQPYLARVIFNEMTKGEEAGTRGYGISAEVGDGADRIVDVDTATQDVGVAGWTGPRVAFREFIAAGTAHWSG